MGESICCVPECGRAKHHRQPFCKRHYYWSREHDGATPTMRVWPTAMERALRMSMRDGDCLIFTGAKSRGYGYIQGDDGKVVSVHRMAWGHAHGPVPEGMEIDHVLALGCTSRACFNVEHLEPVTKAENLRRRVGWSKHGIGRYKGAVHG